MNVIKLFLRFFESSKNSNKEPSEAIDCYDRGIAMYKIGRIPEAIQWFDRAIAIDDSDADFYRSRGGARFWMGKYRDAITDYTTALERRPEDVMALILRSNAWQEIDELSKAEQDLQHAKRIAPSDEHVKEAIASFEAFGKQERIMEELDGDLSKLLGKSPEDIAREAAKRKTERIAEEGVPPIIALEQSRQKLLKGRQKTTEKSDNEGKKR